jgi:hypothetical protein
VLGVSVGCEESKSAGCEEGKCAGCLLGVRKASVLGVRRASLLGVKEPLSPEIRGGSSRREMRTSASAVVRADMISPNMQGGTYKERNRKSSAPGSQDRIEAALSAAAVADTHLQLVYRPQFVPDCSPVPSVHEWPMSRSPPQPLPTALGIPVSCEILKCASETTGNESAQRTVADVGRVETA